MIILAMETSTPQGGVSIIQNSKEIAHESSMRFKSHSDVLHVFIESCLKRAQLSIEDVDYFVAGNGPGSFTGVRVAGNAAKTYSYLFKKPLVVVDTLTTLACQVDEEEHRDLPITSMINAYKNMVYINQFSGRWTEIPKALHEPRAIPVRELKDYIKSPTLVVGDGYNTYKEYFPSEIKKLLIRPKSAQDYPHSTMVGLIAEHKIANKQTLDWNLYAPLYIRASEAEENLRGVLLTPLK